MNVKIIIKIYLIIIILIFVTSGSGCTNEYKLDSQIYYMDVIDPFSSITFDYENPNYCNVTLELVGSHPYTFMFDKNQTYKITSLFNDIAINNLITKDSVGEDFLIKIAQGIKIEVSYRYVTAKNNDNNAVVQFYILKDGTLVFEDSKKISFYCSKKGSVNFEQIREKILEIRSDI